MSQVLGKRLKAFGQLTLAITPLQVIESLEKRHAGCQKRRELAQCLRHHLARQASAFEAALAPGNRGNGHRMKSAAADSFERSFLGLGQLLAFDTFSSLVQGFEPEDGHSRSFQFRKTLEFGATFPQ